jgi:hypothetical protein
MFHKVPRDIFSEPGLVAYIDPKLRSHIFFEANIAIYHTTEVVYRPNWNNNGEHIGGGCIMSAVVGRHGYVTMHSHIKPTGDDVFNDSEVIWGSRQEAVGLLKEAILQFIQYFPQSRDLV